MTPFEMLHIKITSTCGTHSIKSTCQAIRPNYLYIYFQDEFEEIDAVYTEEKKQLNELEERFKTLEEEYTQIMEERRIAREKREAAEREMAMTVGAATTIQAFWRSFKVRKALKSKKKKGKKGKKGKK